MDTVPVLATTSAINKAIGKCYSMQNVDSVIDSVAAMGGDLGEMSQEEADSKDRVESAPIVKLATTIIENSYRADATDIHIEPFEKYTRIRIRVNGDLVELMEHFKCRSQRAHHSSQAHKRHEHRRKENPAGRTFHAGS